MGSTRYRDIIRGWEENKCIKMLSFDICVAVNIKITPEITNYCYFTFYSLYIQLSISLQC